MAAITKYQKLKPEWFETMENSCLSLLEAAGGGGLVAKSCPALATPWTVACQIPLSMGFSRQEYWSGLLFPSPGDLPHPGIKHMSPALAGGFVTSEPPGEPTGSELIPISGGQSCHFFS